MYGFVQKLTKFGCRWKFSRKSYRKGMIVLCEIGWPQKSPWVRMIWMISCKETIKINSKTWLRFRLIIKPNISIHVSHTDEYQKMISLTNSRFRCLWCSVFCVNDFCTTELKWYKTKFCGQARSNPWPRWSACPRFWFFFVSVSVKNLASLSLQMTRTRTSVRCRNQIDKNRQSFAV